MISEFFSLFFLFIISFSIYNHINASYKVGFIIVSRANPCIYTYLVDFLFPIGLGTCICNVISSHMIFKFNIG